MTTNYEKITKDIEKVLDLYEETNLYKSLYCINLNLKENEKNNTKKYFVQLPNVYTTCSYMI